MAYSENALPLGSLLANADFSAATNQFRLMNLNSSGKLVLASAGGRVVGVLHNTPVANQAADLVSNNCITKVRYGGTVAVGDNLKSDANGQAVAAVAADIALGAVVGIALQAGATGEVGCMYMSSAGLQAALTSGIETVTSGAIAVTTRTSLLSVTGTQAYTLADGLYQGQRKSLTCILAASTPAGTVTPANLADFTTLAFNAVYDHVELEFQGTEWRIINLASVVAA